MSATPPVRRGRSLSRRHGEKSGRDGSHHKCGAAADGEEVANPLGLPSGVRRLQAQLAANRSKFYRDLPEGPSMASTARGENPRRLRLELVASGMIGGPGAL